MQHARVSSHTDPLLGWRLWRVRGESLESWAASYVWETGDNVSHCLAPVRRCSHSPGRGCMCGFWGLFSPLRALERGRAERTERSSVLGLIQGWGEVAVHGTEGFRAEHATVACLFTDWIWDAARLPCPKGRLEGLVWRLQQAVGYVPRPTPPDPWRRASIEQAAAHYGIPLLSLSDALEHNVLQEFGVLPSALEEIDTWLELTEEERLRRLGSD
jgi:hypothetical protein